MENPWKTLSKEEKYDNPWINVTEYQVISPTGAPGIYGLVSMKNTAVGVVPIDEEDNIWLVGQYRYATECYSWEIPTGGGSKDVPAEEEAARELKEETGLTASSYSPLLTMHTSNCVTDEVAVIFLATGLQEGETEFDDTEDLEIRKLPFEEALAMIDNGEIIDGITITSLLKLDRLRRKRM